MAFTFRASSVYDNSNSHQATVSIPTGTVDGDIMFALVTNVNYENPSTVPTGWNLIAKKSTWGGYRLYYKIASSEGSSYVWEWGIDNSTKVRVTIATYYGDYDSSNPIGVVSNTAYETSNATVRAASMNVSLVNSPLLFFGLVFKAGSNTFTKPSSPTTDWVENVDAGSENSQLWHTICSMIWTSTGSTGNMDATSSTTYQYDKHAFAVALNPEPDSGPANLKSYNTNLKANIKTINTNPIANVKSLNTNV